jgi:hypothetical protein
MPGVQELQLVTGETAGTSLFDNPRLEMIVLKRGKKGCSIFTRRTRWMFRPVEEVTRQEMPDFSAGYCRLKNAVKWLRPPARCSGIWPWKEISALLLLQPSSKVE